LDTLLPEVDAELDHPPDGPIMAAERAELTRAAMVARLEVSGAQRLGLTQADSAARAAVSRWMEQDSPPGRAQGRGR
jgi:hypothetical protein